LLNAEVAERFAFGFVFSFSIQNSAFSISAVA